MLLKAHTQKLPSFKQVASGVMTPLATCIDWAGTWFGEPLAH